MPKLVALERFFYAGRNVEMGETFTVDERDIALLTDAVKPMAKHPDRGEPDPPEPEIDEPLGRTKKPDSETQGERRIYKRRDMKAGD
jgi:hypothetical protein